MSLPIAKRPLHAPGAPTQAQQDLAYWLAQPPEARIAAVEALRQQHHRLPGQPHADIRLQSVCRIAQRPAR